MIFRDPLNRGQVLSCSDRCDKQDIIVENTLRQAKEFSDMDKSTQLTQNSWNMSPYTRTDAYRDISISNPMPIGRIERYRNKITRDKYHQHF